MAKNYPEIVADISGGLAVFKKEMPDVMNGFMALMQAATKEGALSKKTKELIALALGIAAHCDGCIGLHVQTLVKLGVTRQELLEMFGMAVLMGGGPSLMFAVDALRAFEEFTGSQGK